MQSIEKLALAVPGIKGVHDIVVHNYGQKNAVSLHVEVEKTLALPHAHQLAKAVEGKIQDKTEASVVVHVDLHKQKSRVTNAQLQKILNKIMRAQPAVINYHQVNFASGQGVNTLDFHVMVKHDMPVNESHELCHLLTDQIKRKLPGHAINIHMEPCNINCKACPKECKEKQ